MKKTFTGNTRLFLCISGAIIAIALIMQIAGAGLNLGIDFTGGSILNYSVGEDYDVNDVEAILNASGYTDNQITKAAPSAASKALQAELAAEVGVLTVKQQKISRAGDHAQAHLPHGAEHARPFARDQRTQRLDIGALAQGGKPRLLRDQGDRPGLVAAAKPSGQRGAAAERIAEAQPGHRVGLGERPQHDELRAV